MFNSTNLFKKLQPISFLYTYCFKLWIVHFNILKGTIHFEFPSSEHTPFPQYPVLKDVKNRTKPRRECYLKYHRAIPWLIIHHLNRWMKKKSVKSTERFPYRLLLSQKFKSQKFSGKFYIRLDPFLLKEIQMRIGCLSR